VSQLKNKRQLITVLDPRSPVSESYRTLRTNLDFSSIDEKLQVLIVTSAGPGEGKSTTITNLAVTFAQSERKVVLIDCDMRKPTAHHTFTLSNRVGLSSVLSSQLKLQDVIQPSPIPNLDIITSGNIPPNPTEMIASNRMTTMLEELKQMYDMILIDTPPLLAVTDAQIAATKSDGVVLVIDQGKVKKEVALKATKSLELVKARLLGVVLNNVKRSAKDQTYYYYYGNNPKR